jgi:hypothetical protein
MIGFAMLSREQRQVLAPVLRDSPLCNGAVR